MTSIIKILKYCRCEQKRIIITIFFNILTSSFAILSPLLYARIVTYLLDKDHKNLVINLIVLAICYLLSWIVSYVHKRMELIITKNINFNMKKVVNEQLFTIPNYELDYNHGKMFSLLFSDTNTVYSIFSVFVSSIFTLINVVGIGIVIFFINWQLSLILLSVYPFVYLLNNVFQKKIKEKTVAVLEQNDTYISSVKNMVGNMNDVKAQDGNEKIKKELDDIANVGKKLTITQSITQINFFSGISLLNLIGYLSLTVVGIVFVLLELLSFGNFIAFNTYSKNLSTSLDSLVNLKTSIQPSLVSIERLIQLDNLYQEAQKSQSNKTNLDEKINSIAFNNVSLSFEEKPVIKNINVELNKGNIIGIRGDNGSGKTSLANLLVQNLLPSSGIIDINGSNYLDLKYCSLKQHISYAGASKILYHLSILDNLTLFNGKEQINYEKIVQSCKKVGIYEDILSLPNGFNTIVSDAFNLSSGQIQKIQIARILLKDTEVIILDEALSNLDIYTKNNVKNELKSIAKEKLIIIISHDKTDYDICDEIFEFTDCNLIRVPQKNLVSSL